MNNTLNLALQRVSRSQGVDLKLVERIYRSYWCFIKETISSVTLKDFSEEEFNSADINFNLPLLGKLYVEYYKIEKYQKQLKETEDVKVKEY